VSRALRLHLCVGVFHHRVVHYTLRAGEWHSGNLGVFRVFVLELLQDHVHQQQIRATP